MAAGSIATYTDLSSLSSLTTLPPSKTAYGGLCGNGHRQCAARTSRMRSDEPP
jgi:hypothetical protein